MTRSPQSPSDPILPFCGAESGNDDVTDPADDGSFRSGSYLGDRMLQLLSEGRGHRKPSESEAPQPKVVSESDATETPAATGPAKMPPAKESNRRTYPRRLSECQVAIHRCQRDAPVRWVEKDWLLHASKTQGLLRDISMSGVSFTVAERIEAGDVLMMRITNPKLGTTVDTAGRVVRVSHESDRRYVVVLRLDQKLSYDEISPLRLQFSDVAVG